MRKKLKCLIVDDEAPHGLFLKALLEQHGFPAEHVSSGFGAMQHLETTRYDAVITDIYMPGEDGIELLQRIKRRHSDLPVIAMTESILAPTIERVFMVMGGLRLFRKPIVPAELIGLLDEIARGDAPTPRTED